MESKACKALLNTAEILEALLLQTDPKTVLLARRVCVTWNDLISNSPSIQQHLFFRPIPGTTPVVLNPILAEAFPPFFQRAPLAGTDYEVSAPAKRLNPEALARRMQGMGFFSRTPQDPYTPIYGAPYEEEPDVHPHFTPEDLEDLPLAQDHLNAAFLYERATWRAMLPCQPPPTSFICLTKGGSMGLEEQDFRRISENGVVFLDYDGEVPEGKEYPSQGAPVRMETLFHLVTGGWGDVNGWVWTWATEGSETLIPKDVEFGAIYEARREVMKRAVQRDGLCLIETSVTQCIVDAPGPWSFGNKSESGLPTISPGDEGRDS
ncbi:unnamed protein product [Clonostachys rhizophaga]|uniref:F-box domain-containing protein n=1 Tax=Clonostachys rhizophaga TaxID=160324 RepID=A0A9N9VPZ9_9HYPO|nr:unnamed protein product [Clonostachys rhizophaga]